MSRPGKVEAQRELHRSQQLQDGTIAASAEYRRLMAEACERFDALLAREAKPGRVTKGGKKGVHIACGKRKTRKCA